MISKLSQTWKNSARSSSLPSNSARDPSPSGVRGRRDKVHLASFAPDCWEALATSLCRDRSGSKRRARSSSLIFFENEKIGRQEQFSRKSIGYRNRRAQSGSLPLRKDSCTEGCASSTSYYFCNKKAIQQHYFLQTKNGPPPTCASMGQTGATASFSTCSSTPSVLTADFRLGEASASQ